MLSLSGCQFNDNIVTLTLQNNGVTSTMECNLIHQNRFKVWEHLTPVLRLVAPRVMTEEQRRILSERAKASLRSKSMVIIGDSGDEQTKAV